MVLLKHKSGQDAEKASVARSSMTGTSATGASAAGYSTAASTIDTNGHGNGDGALPPPAYAAMAPPQQPLPADPNSPEARAALTAAFSNLSFAASGRQEPQRDECLAHLKLLFAFQTLKEDVGYTNGLFDLWDSRAVNPDGSAAAAVPQGTDPREVLAKVREKRWALYVARAVDRYERWWKAVQAGAVDAKSEWCVGSVGRQGRMLVESDFRSSTGLEYGRFTTSADRISWREDMLPPPGKTSPPSERTR